jgi:hypothetical protein
MTHPLTPPPELVQQLYGLPQMRAIEKAYQAGADQELEALLVWLRVKGFDNLAADLLAARRPKPPSLKEQALALIDDCTNPEGDYLDDNALSIIRRALEALPDD